MTRVVYKINDGYGEVREAVGEGLMLTIAVKPDTGGYITLGNVTKRIVSGECLFNLERIPDGEYTPKISGPTPATLEPLCKLSGRIFPLPTPDATVRRLLLRTEVLEAKCEALSKELTELLSLLDSRIIL